MDSDPSRWESLPETLWFIMGTVGQIFAYLMSLVILGIIVWYALATPARIVSRRVDGIELFIKMYATMLAVVAECVLLGITSNIATKYDSVLIHIAACLFGWLCFIGGCYGIAFIFLALRWLLPYLLGGAKRDRKDSMELKDLEQGS